MTTTTRERTAPAGGSFLTGSAQPGSVFTPERLSDEHREMRNAVRTFVEREVGRVKEQVEGKDYETHRSLLRRLGEDGYLGIDIPEQYGGAGLDRISSLVVNEAISIAGSFAVTYSAHTGIGTLPLVFFGTDAQKARYLPGLADGSRVGAYALTEPSAGSDAMGIRTKAVRQPDGSWRLDGSKQFITNAAFADLFTVYAKIDGEQFSAFLVERDTPGLAIGPEEHKMGLHGCSTCPITLDGVVVPAENLLGEPGKGHRVAFNVLNVGRFKLAAACLGGMRDAVGVAVGYARDRAAFGRKLTEFPLIAAKLATMAARTYAVESATYRIAGLLEDRLAAAESGEAQSSDAIRSALEEYAVECSIAKVLASEELGYVVDELVQVHGGYGYIEEYPAAGFYRDARIHRIWEGTNEINRLLVPGTLLKRAMTGRLDLLGPAQRASEALLGGEQPTFDGELAAERSAVAATRTTTLLLAGAAVQRFGAGLEAQQEILAAVADLAIDLFAMESALERAAQASSEGAASAPLHADLARLVITDRGAAVEQRAKWLAASLAEGDEARTLQAGVRRLMRGEPRDRVALLRRIGAAVIKADGYPI
ncbi:MAG TPA: acyl-CoA dehydrogenase family protein [Candidatus Limnocylindria bacterium]|nr:acyl-CoA dehydrogenase family protein [Candidatus Limnocylindria bacterium]